MPQVQFEHLNPPSSSDDKMLYGSTNTVSQMDHLNQHMNTDDEKIDYNELNKLLSNNKDIINGQDRR